MTQNTAVQAHPTMYRGLQFRSRLEATWAAFFDLVEWPWEYEPIELNGYIPDFILKFPTPLLVEVKPANSFEEMEQYCGKIEASGWKDEYLILGTGPIAIWDCSALGLLAEQWSAPLINARGKHVGWKRDGWAAGKAMFGPCPNPGPFHFGIVHEIQSYHCRVCGKYNGKSPWFALNEFNELWFVAKNETQWNSPRR